MSRSPFRLEPAIAAWRRSLTYNRAFSPEDLDELERHLRDQVEALVISGATERAAFHQALQDMGPYGAVEDEYRKVYWGKRRRRGEVLPELIHRGAMLKNYLTLALRTLRREKVYAFLNIFGLALGLACFVLIALYIQHEHSYDQFHAEGDQIFRVVQERPTSNGSIHWTVTSPALANALEAEFPEVVQSTSVGYTYDPLLSTEVGHFEEYGLFVDPDFLSMFSFELLEGDAETALAQPDGMVLTASLARTLFGAEDPIGQSVRYQNQDLHTVTGIVADVPETSHLKFDYLLPAIAHEWYRNGIDKPIWYNNGWYTYLVLNEAAAQGTVEAKIKTLTDEGLADWRPEDRMTFTLQPLADIHLQSTHLSTMPFERGGNVQYIYLFVVLGMTILLLACINYTNLAVARSIKRRREVGLRRAIGAVKGQLVGQFLGESLLMAFLALALALGLTHLLLPTAGYLVERPLTIDYFGNGWLIPGLLLLVALVGVLAGSYPAFYMARLRPIQALAGRPSQHRRRISLQKVLIVGQYAVAIVLVAGSLVVHQQMRYIQSRDLGYDREHVVTIEANDEALGQNYDAIRDAWLREAAIEQVSYSRYPPTNIATTQGMYAWEGSSEDERLSTSTTSADYDFLELYGLEVIAGRGFSRAFATDTLGAPIALVNRATVDALGWTPEYAIGQRFWYTDDTGWRTIIGVIEDLHINSVHQELGPFVLTLDRNRTGYISVKLRPDDLPRTLALFEQTVAEYSPYPFTYQFLDERFDALHRQDLRLGELFGLFTVLAFLIASFGLFGLAAYAAEQRTKEVGVRRTLGASVSSLVVLLSKDFVLLVGLAFVIAAPVAYFAMREWLEAFVYQVDLGPGLFLLAGAAALLIAFATVSSQALRGALADPVDTLRHE